MSCQNCVEIRDKFLLWHWSQAFSFSLNKSMGDTNFLEPLSQEFEHQRARHKCPSLHPLQHCHSSYRMKSISILQSLKQSDFTSSCVGECDLFSLLNRAFCQLPCPLQTVKMRVKAKSFKIKRFKPKLLLIEREQFSLNEIQKYCILGCSIRFSYGSSASCLYVLTRKGWVPKMLSQGILFPVFFF